MTKKSLLITGANGFVGQHVVSCFRSQYRIIGLTNRGSSQLDKGNNITYREGEITDPEFISRILDEFRPDYILHLAAMAQTWNSNTKEIFDVNVIGTINVYDSVVRIRQRYPYEPKIVFISSSEIYGNTNQHDPITEDMMLSPTNPYAASKASADRVSYTYTQSQKLNIVIARPFTHTGPGQRTGFFVPDMASQIAAIENTTVAKPTLLVGNLDSYRDYLDVRDVIEAYGVILESDIQPGEAFNICSGSAVQMSDILKRLLQQTTVTITIKQDPKKLRASDVPYFVGDNSKLQAITGWQPKIPLDKTLQDTLMYWREYSSDTH